MPLPQTKYHNVENWASEDFNSGGTREKQILISPDDIRYYFKKSLRKKEKYYKYEFWSEVIASQIERFFGFNVITYDVAYMGNEIGCISQTIIDKAVSELNSGYNYLLEIFPELAETNPDYKKHHTFQNIIKVLKHNKLERFNESVIEMIIFDAIIGNNDRHSENWTIIISDKQLNTEIVTIKQNFALLSQKFHKENSFYEKHGSALNELEKEILEEEEKIKENNFIFSPLYDNGSSLGRELEDGKINKYLENNELQKYLKGGKSDIRYNDKKLNFFELIESIKADYKEYVDNAINRIKERYNEELIIEIVNNVDNELPEKFNEYKLPNNRKEFIIKCLNARIDKIIKIGN